MNLAKALLALKTEKEMNNFLRDLCTPGEIKDFEERWAIAQLLNTGEFSYRQIAEKASASITTVTRVARFLKDEPYQGYSLALSRNKKSASHHRH
jgi:TrpR-related protein YerC/YecD